MDEQTQKKIKEKFDSLPEAIKETIMSSRYQDDLIEVGQKYQLSTEQLGLLERETTLVLMGLTPPDEFAEELQRELAIDNVRIGQMIEDIGQKVFMPLKTLLKIMYTPEGEAPEVEDEDEEEPAAAVQSAYFDRNLQPPVHEVPREAVQVPIKSDSQVLSSAGIELAPKKAEIRAETPVPVEAREEIMAKVEHPDNVVPAAVLRDTVIRPAPATIVEAPKAQAPVQAPPPSSAPVQAPAPASVSAAPARTADPYRMPIE